MHSRGLLLILLGLSTLKSGFSTHQLFYNILGGSIGYLIGMILTKASCVKIPDIAVIQKALSIATPEERQFLFSHLCELGVLLGILCVEEKWDPFLIIMKAEMLINLTNRIGQLKDQNRSIQSITNILSDWRWYIWY